MFSYSSSLAFEVVLLGRPGFLAGGILPEPPAPDLLAFRLRMICRTLSCDEAGRGFHFLRMVD